MSRRRSRGRNRRRSRSGDGVGCSVVRERDREGYGFSILYLICSVMQMTTITGNACAWALWLIAMAIRKQTLSFVLGGKLNISLEFSWRPRDVIITQKPTHQHFALHKAHSHVPPQEKQMELIF